MVIGLIFAELAVLIWGYWVFSQADSRQCGQAPEIDVHEPGELPWLPWLVLAPLVGIALKLRKDRLTTAISGASLLVLVFTFPGTIIVVESLSCSG